MSQECMNSNKKSNQIKQVRISLKMNSKTSVASISCYSELV